MVEPDEELVIHTGPGFPLSQFPFRSQHSSIFPEHKDTIAVELHTGIAPLQQSLLPFEQYALLGFCWQNKLPEDELLEEVVLPDEELVIKAHVIVGSSELHPESLQQAKAFDKHNTVPEEQIDFLPGKHVGNC